MADGPFASLKAAAILLLSAPIHFYRYALSPLLPPACRFQPTCSAYALQALQVHGPFKGLWLAIRRLSRCHPIPFLGGSGGYDPVPAPCHHEHAPESV